MEGTLTIKLDDGRELSELFFGVQHALRIVEAWGAGECPGLYQAASGEMCQCARPMGHAGYHAHRMERGD